MSSKRSNLFLAALAIALAVPVAARAELRDIDDVPAPDKATALKAWTPAQQYIPTGGRGRVAASNAYSMLVMADELGNKLSELGRFSLIEHCFETEPESASAMLAWALCGSDVKALDTKKLGAELAAGHISRTSRGAVLARVSRVLTRAKKIGEVVEAAAKTDPGIAAVLELPVAAKQEWGAYIANHKAAFERYLALKDALRSQSPNHKSFAGCWQATRPAFEKLVRATTFPWELPGSYLTGYAAVMLTSPESYITAAAWSACAVSVDDKAGRAVAAVVLDQKIGGIIRVGWRTLAVAKALDPRFKPTFADSTLDYGAWGIPRRWREIRYETDGIAHLAADRTPVQGTLASVEKAGDLTHLSFKSDKVPACLDKLCKHGDIEIATKLVDGMEAGVDVMMYDGFPVCVWQGRKLAALFTVTVK